MYQRENKFYYSWSDFETSLQYMEKKIRLTSNIKNINLVTLYRGGLPFGTALSNRLDTELNILDYQRYDGDNKSIKFLKDCGIIDGTKIILVDDIADEGITILESIKFLNEKYPNSRIHILTMIGKSTHPTEWDYCFEHQGWSVFPYENNEIVESCINCNESESCMKYEDKLHYNIHNKSFPMNHSCVDFN